MKAIIKISILFVLLFCIISQSKAQYNYNQAAVFNGTNSYIAVPNSAKLNPSAITIEAWINPASEGAFNTIIGKNRTTGFAFGLGNGKLQFIKNNFTAFGNTTIPLNTWTHVAVAYDGINTTTYYVNGNQDGTSTVMTGAITSTTDSLRIGADVNSGLPGLFFSGMIDEVTIWNSVLSQSTISYYRFTPLAIAVPLTGGGSTNYYKNLIAAYRLNGDIIPYAFDEIMPSANGITRNITYKNYSDKFINYVEYNSSAYFDGTQGYLASPNYQGQNSTTAITLEAWIRKINIAGQFMGIVNKSGGTNRADYSLYVQNSTLYFSTGTFLGDAGNSSTISVTASALATSQWVHVAATYNAANGMAKLYVNGDSVAAKTFTGSLPIPNNPDSLFIGGYGAVDFSSYKFSGYIDEVRNWKNTVRTSAEIKANMYKNIDFNTAGHPAISSLAVFGFNGKNYNEVENINLNFPVQVMNFRGTSVIVSSKIPGVSNSPMLRDDVNDFAGPSYAVNYKRVSIPDNNPAGVLDSVYIGSPGLVTSLKIFVLINHTWVSDLFSGGIRLTGPTGISVVLTPAGNGSNGIDMNTIFSMSADTTITSATNYFAPFSPSIRPANSLSVFTGTQRQGWWKLKIVDAFVGDLGVLNGWGIQTTPLTGIEPTVSTLSGKYELAQNFPNPFNPSTKINFSIPKESVVKLAVYDMLGKEVEVLVNDSKKAGSYSVEFNAGRLSSGIYFYKIETDGFIETKKMMLVK